MSTLLTEGQYVIPEKANNLSSFSFLYQTTEQAIEQLHVYG